MKRRDLIVGGIGAAGLAAASKTKAQKKDVFKWKMVTTWPPNFPGLGTGAMRMAKNIEAASGGRIKIKVFAFKFLFGNIGLTLIQLLIRLYVEL